MAKSSATMRSCQSDWIGASVERTAFDDLPILRRSWLASGVCPELTQLIIHTEQKQAAFALYPTQAKAQRNHIRLRNVASFNIIER
eukprot:5945426-Amphidinium_carterae.1